MQEPVTLPTSKPPSELLMRAEVGTKVIPVQFTVSATRMPPTTATSQKPVVTLNSVAPCAAVPVPLVVEPATESAAHSAAMDLHGGAGTLTDCSEGSESGGEESEPYDVMAGSVDENSMCDIVEEPCIVGVSASPGGRVVTAASSVAKTPHSVTNSSRPADTTMFCVTVSSSPTSSATSSSLSQRSCVPTTTVAATQSLPLSPSPVKRKNVRTVEAAARPSSVSIVLQDTHREADANKVRSDTTHPLVAVDPAPYSSSLTDALFYKVLISYESHTCCHCSGISRALWPSGTVQGAAKLH